MIDASENVLTTDIKDAINDYVGDESVPVVVRYGSLEAKLSLPVIEVAFQNGIVILVVK